MWRGVQKWGYSFAVHVKLPQPGGASPLRTRLGYWPTHEAAARVYDAATIAILGPKVRPPAAPSPCVPWIAWHDPGLAGGSLWAVLPQASAAPARAEAPPPLLPTHPCAQAAAPSLNFPLSQYRGARQLMGPELSALLQQLRCAGAAADKAASPAVPYSRRCRPALHCAWSARAPEAASPCPRARPGLQRGGQQAARRQGQKEEAQGRPAARGHRGAAAGAAGATQEDAGAPSGRWGGRRMGGVC